MNLNPLPKCIFLLSIADAKVLGNVQHAQADLMLLISRKIHALLGTGGQNHRHYEQNLPFLVVLDEAGKHSKCGGPGPITKKSVKMTRASTGHIGPLSFNLAPKGPLLCRWKVQ